MCENEIRRSPDKLYPTESEYYSPFDDSDADPDYEPNLSEETSGKRKCPPKFFKESDFKFPEEKFKKLKIIDYKDYSAVFPSPEATWETKGSTDSEKNILLEKGFHVSTENDSRDEILVYPFDKFQEEPVLKPKNNKKSNKKKQRKVSSSSAMRK